MWREENLSARKKKKNLGARTTTKNNFNPHMTPSPGIEPGPYWWEESALSTAPSLLPDNGGRRTNDVSTGRVSTWKPECVFSASLRKYIHIGPIVFNSISLDNLLTFKLSTCSYRGYVIYSPRAKPSGVTHVY